MRWRALVLVAVTACRSEDKPAPKPAPPKDARAVHAQLLGCAPAMPLPIDPREAKTIKPGRYVPPLRATGEWTPFAYGPVVVEDSVSKPAASELADAMSERLKLVDTCFGDATGVVRAMIAIDTTGIVQSVRAGGLGDAKVEDCIEFSALSGLRIHRLVQFVELACDFARGRTDAPLRVSPDGGYTVVQVDTHEVRVDGATHALPAQQRITSLGAKSAILIVADPDATPEGINFALWWAPPGTTTLVAIKAAGGAPVFAGMGDARADRAKTNRRVLQLKTDNGRMHACLAGVELGDAALVDFRAMDDVMKKARAACDAQPCEWTTVVGTDGAFVAKDLVATTSAARRAGFAMLSIGGPACD